MRIVTISRHCQARVWPALPRAPYSPESMRQRLERCRCKPLCFALAGPGKLDDFPGHDDGEVRSAIAET